MVSMEFSVYLIMIRKLTLAWEAGQNQQHVHSDAQKLSPRH